MIYPWTGYARELLHTMFDITASPAPATWLQAITDSCHDITTEPELQQLAMECLRSMPPSHEDACTAFYTLCALFDHFWSGHASLSVSEIQAYFLRWLEMQPPTCHALPAASRMQQWLDASPCVQVIHDAQCHQALSGTLEDIASLFHPSPHAASLQRSSLLSPCLVKVRSSLTTPRMFAMQTEMAQILGRRLALPSFSVPAFAQENLQNLVIDGTPHQLHEAQVKAVSKALSCPLTVITGGPGTGKTSIIQKILEISVHGLKIAPERILLSAPTGKAARRMGEATQIPGIPTPQTLHRLLQLRPNSMSPFDAQNPIQADFIIIDELSMLGFDLAVNLLRAVSEKTRLILIGDPEQLPPVDSGNLLEALVSPSQETMTDIFADKLAQSCVKLTKNYRIQAKDTDKANHIFNIQNAVMAKSQGEPAFQRLTPKAPAEFNFEDFEYCNDMTQTQNALDIWIQQIQKTWAETQSSSEFSSLTHVLHHPYPIQDNRIAPHDEELLFKVFTHLEKFRLLTPMNRSSFGASAFNRYLIHQLQLKADSKSAQLPLGCLVLLTQNSYQIQHFNGETGLIIQDQSHHKYVAFPSADSEHSQTDKPRFDLFSLEQVPQIIPAFAMSVHKSQGSQYDHVLIILSPYPSPLLSANMLYTAISRSKRSAALLAAPQILPACFRS